ncbi:Oxygen tolerance [Pustulibacterium marinum]|uniref:Oxygen tolerance n=1 Tax=Pustulibacterium marinum TaxID=1224947 RepID=A0A1I7HI41_9FLAO|nr:BatD family protein [Pustulibacterium marinum]SFU60229.1 Oxygen tolerance [Pustulibacterium marinum]
MKQIITLIFVLFTFSWVSAQDDAVTFEATVSKKTLGINERLRVEFSMNQDGDNFNPPDFNNFRVVAGPSQSTSFSFTNGKRSFNRSYSYILQPTARGTFKIGQASIEIDDKIYKTVPVEVTVTAAVENPNAPPSADQIADENLHLVAEVSKSNPYLNEAVSVVYKLYFSSTVSIENFQPLDDPKYNNFWSQNIDIDQLQVEQGTYDGKRYRYVVLKKVVLYPQQSGELNIEPLSLDITVGVPTSRRDFFGRPIYEKTHKTVSAGSRKLNVKPLPTEGKPEEFSGAVGQFNFDVTVNKDSLRASESLMANVRVSGKGNLKLLTLPKLKTPSALETYDPEYEENVRVSLSGMQGSVSEDYTIVSRYKGKYPIPAVNFTYFDPETKSYKTITSKEIEINVLDGPTNNVAATQIPSGTNKQEVVSIGTDFRFIKIDPNLTSKTKSNFFKSTLYYVLLYLPLLLIPIVILARNKREAYVADVQGNKIRKANKLAKKYLSAARKTLGNKEAFYVALEKALHNYLKAKLHIETSEFSKEKISQLLAEKDVAQEDIHEFVNLLKSCELARYSPASEVTMQQDYDKAASVITKIDKQI